MKFLRIAIVTKIERNQALSLADKVLSGHGGWIVDHAMFSNIAANVNFELPVEKSAMFVAGLEAAGFTPNIQGDLPTGDSGEVKGSLQFTFLHDEPDRKNAVPAFG